MTEDPDVAYECIDQLLALNTRRRKAQDKSLIYFEKAVLEQCAVDSDPVLIALAEDLELRSRDWRRSRWCRNTAGYVSFCPAGDRGGRVGGVAPPAWICSSGWRHIPNGWSNTADIKARWG